MEKNLHCPQNRVHVHVLVSGKLHYFKIIIIMHPSINAAIHSPLILVRIKWVGNVFTIVRFLQNLQELALPRPQESPLSKSHNTHVTTCTSTSLFSVSKSTNLKSTQYTFSLATLISFNSYKLNSILS